MIDQNEVFGLSIINKNKDDPEIPFTTKQYNFK